MTGSSFTMVVSELVSLSIITIPIIIFRIIDGDSAYLIMKMYVVCTH